MLLVTRRAGEKIMLGDDIVVEVMEIAGNTVRIGIQAPRSLPVYREEIWDVVRAENRAAGRRSSRQVAAPNSSTDSRWSGPRALATSADMRFAPLSSRSCSPCRFRPS